MESKKSLNKHDKFRKISYSINYRSIKLSYLHFILHENYLYFLPSSLSIFLALFLLSGTCSSYKIFIQLYIIQTAPFSLLMKLEFSTME